GSRGRGEQETTNRVNAAPTRWHAGQVPHRPGQGSRRYERRRRSGVLDQGELELEGDLVADQDAAGLQGRVPGDAVVLAVDGDRAPEADPQVAERVLGRALV